MKKFIAMGLAVISACVGHAQTSITVEQGVNYSVLTRTDVIKELKITDAQKKAIEEAISANEISVQKEIDSKIKSDGELEISAIQKAINEITDKHTKLFAKKLAELLSADQNTRFYEVELQLAGVSGLERKAVAKALDLSAEQTAKVKNLIEDINEATQGMLENAKMEELPGGAGVRMTLDPEDEKKLALMGSKALEEVKKTFSDAQKKQWIEMTGLEFHPAK